MTYKGAIEQSMTMLAEDPKRRFVGYGLLRGKNGNGMKHVPDSSIFEMPVAENMMTGAAQGMAMCGLKPVVIFERADFLHCATDAIVNHLAKCREISRDQFNPCVIIRVVIGNKENPLFTGPTHTSNPAEAYRELVRLPIYVCNSSDAILTAYEMAMKDQDKGCCSSMIFEKKDLY